MHALEDMHDQPFRVCRFMEAILLATRLCLVSYAHFNIHMDKCELFKVHKYCFKTFKGFSFIQNFYIFKMDTSVYLNIWILL